MSAIRQNLSQLWEQIAAAARRAGRDQGEITLVGVTKTQPVEAVLEALDAGLRHLGENRVAELSEKRCQVEERRAGGRMPTWHMIGHIQSRKASDVIASADMIHSLDSVKLARRLERFAAEAGRVVPVLLEVNASGEGSKYGLPVHGWGEDGGRLEGLRKLVAEVLQSPHLRLEGLMTMAPWVSDPEVIRPVFRSARLLRERLASEYPGADWRHLSMGMTDDFEIAIEEGATIIRVGRALFGPRRLTA
jgi:pyridoxal phosphate enzyme (YggS family)